ncbi:MAG: hypothetical protein ABR499_01670 [Gemmatimonadaceae bacterium]
MESLLPPFFHGTLREHYLILFGAAGGIALVTGLVSAWLGAFVGARRAARRTMLEAMAAQPSHMSEARLNQLVDAVDAIALEVERISEAQRFTARLLAERQAPAPPLTRRDPGAITPH